MKTYRDTTFLIALNLLALDLILAAWRLAVADFAGAAQAALLGGTLYVLMRVAVLTLKLEERDVDAEKQEEPAASGGSKQD